MSKQEILQPLIDSLRTRLPDCTGVVIATSDGLPVCHSITTGDPARIAALAATALGLGRRITENLGAGALAESVFVGRDGMVCVYAAGLRGVMAVVTSSPANQGLVHLESRDVAAKVAEAL
jgi:predicted regulator of Ras-like GTPase activity (Roadblock/LC7/MglB family)